MEHLLMRIHGPIASWGDIAPGTHRPTFGMPTRSAILGLLASALGIPRDADERHHVLSRSVGIAARLEAAGAMLSDYHTVQVPSSERGALWLTRRDELTRATKVNTILSRRDHVQDAAYTVAVWPRPPGTPTLGEIADALTHPRYPPYLGRRACPTALPFGAHIVTASTLREAFDKAAFPALDVQLLRRLARGGKPTRRVEFDEHPSPGYERTSTRTQRDDVTSRSRWKFGERVLYHAIHPAGER